MMNLRLKIFAILLTLVLGTLGISVIGAIALLAIKFPLAVICLFAIGVCIYLFSELNNGRLDDLREYLEDVNTRNQKRER